MTEYRPLAPEPDRTATPVSQGEAVGRAGPERAAIVIVGRDLSVRKELDEELSRRYGTDYRIVVCEEPAVLEPLIDELRGDGAPVALVIGAVGETEPDGIDVLARVRAIYQTVSRVAAVAW